MHCVIDAILPLPDLDLGCPADADHRDPAGKLGEPLLELLTIVVRCGLLDLHPDLGNPSLDVGLLAGAADDRGVLLLDQHLLGTAEHVERHMLELDAEVLGDNGATG
jgi:hypothetical protein